MSLGNGTHWKGPLLGSDDGGPFEDIGQGEISNIRSPYNVHVERFDALIASATEFATLGCTITDLNTATAPTTISTKETRYLLCNPGTKNNSGTLYQWNAVATDSRANDIAELKSIGPMTSTATLMDGQEMAFEARIGLMSDTTAWDGIALLGWITTDTTPFDTTSGVPTLATGGGLGFHFGIDGVLSYFAQQTALAAVATMNQTSTDITTMTTAAVPQWYKLGFRWRSIDASAGTGTADFWVNDVKQTQISTDLPMQSTQVYSVTHAICNGAARDSDMVIDYIMTAISGPGRTLAAGN